MRSLDKKGVELSLGFIVLVVLAIVAGIAFFAWTNIYGDIAEDVSRTEACRLSVLQKARGIVGEAEIRSFELKCPTESINIIDSRDKKIDGMENIIAKDDEDVKKVIAGEMYNCWYKFGNGKVNFVEGSLTPIPENVCYICSDIRFGERLRANTKINGEVRNLEKYLIDNDVPGRKLSYWEYFGGNVDLKEDVPELNIKMDKPVAVVFGVAKKGVWGGWITSGGTALAVGGIVSLIAGPGWILAAGTAAYAIVGGTYQVTREQESRAYMIVWPLDDVIGKCEYI